MSGNEFAGGSSSSRPQRDMKDQVTPRISDVKGKGKERQEDFVTPFTSRTVGQKRFDDYSAFKGRGRYARGGDARYGLINPSFLSPHFVYQSPSNLALVKPSTLYTPLTQPRTVE